MTRTFQIRAGDVVQKPASEGETNAELRLVVVEEAKKEPQAAPFLPSANAVLLSTCFAVAGVWLWLYTDALAIFAGSFGLVTVVVGAVTRLQGAMSNERRTRYAKALDRMLFESSGAGIVYVLLLSAIVFVGFICIQPVTVRAAASVNAETITLTLRRQGLEGQSVVRLRAEPGKTQRLPVLRPQFGGADHVTLEAKALPRIERDLSRLGGVEIVYPVDFWAEPAIIMRAAPSIMEMLWASKPILKIESASETGPSEECVAEERYLGEPVWLGTGGRALPVEEGDVARWQAEASLYASRQGLPDLREKVLATSAAAPCAQSLQKGDTVKWSLISHGQNKVVLHDGTIRISGNETYPLNVSLELEGPDEE